MYHRKIDQPENEIDNLVDQCNEYIQEGTSRYPGMSYEQGIKDAIEWITGESNDYPLE